MQPCMPAGVARSADPVRWCGGDLDAIDKFWRSSPRCRCFVIQHLRPSPPHEGGAHILRPRTDMREDFAGVAALLVGTFTMATSRYLAGGIPNHCRAVVTKTQGGGGVMF